MTTPPRNWPEYVVTDGRDRTGFGGKLESTARQVETGYPGFIQKGVTLSRQQISEPTTLSVKQDSTDRINRAFDNAELIVERTGVLLSKCEPVALKLFLLLHLLFDLGVILWILLRK